MSIDPSERSKTSAFEWHNHLALLVGAAASTLICLKLLAVADWNSTTAFGILAASGTANVLVGTLLAILPMLYGIIAVVVWPRIELWLRRRNSAERGAARLIGVWPLSLVFSLVPTMQLLGILAGVLILISVYLIRRHRAQRPVEKRRKAASNPDDAISRFEAISLGLAGYSVLFFGSLSVPWMPAQMVDILNDEQVVYVLNSEGEAATVLLADERTIVEVQAEVVKGKYCERDSHWWNKPIQDLFSDNKYPDCLS